ncbi:hypothetical protein AB9P05_14840 [Roseivirga sp. BDSF3-8]|uniref:hypothetical protein n=1 Tax=Roseivirga sp. BDSF3-8 TaxID=3241598 RepID=UPI003531B2F1
MHNYRYVWLLLTMLSLPSLALGQNPALDRGPVTSATAHTTTLTGTDAIMANPAGLSEADETTARFTAITRFGEAAFTTMGATALIDFRQANLEIGASHFGDDVFGIDRISIATGHKLGIASLGVRLHAFTYRTEATGSRTIPVFEAGGIADLSEKLSVGAWILNPGQARISEAEYFPTLMSMGITYRLAGSLSLLAEVEKDIDRSAVIKAGLNYVLNEYVSTMIGVRTEGHRMSAGLAFHKHSFSFHYAGMWAGLPGFSHQIALDYAIGKP